ncbi:MAG: hypothetical protein ABSE73_22385, partial [Planctomycetota bacterium]
MGLIAPLPKEILKLFSECNALYSKLLQQNHSYFLKSALDNDEPHSYYTIGEVVFGRGGLERRFELEPQRHRGTEAQRTAAFMLLQDKESRALSLCLCVSAVSTPPISEQGLVISERGLVKSEWNLVKSERSPVI